MTVAIHPSLWLPFTPVRAATFTPHYLSDFIYEHPRFRRPASYGVSELAGPLFILALTTTASLVVTRIGAAGKRHVDQNKDRIIAATDVATNVASVTDAATRAAQMASDAADLADISVTGAARKMPHLAVRKA